MSTTSGSSKRPAAEQPSSAPLPKRRRNETNQAFNSTDAETIPQYSHYLTDDEKNATLRHMLASCLKSTSLAPSALAAVAREHNVPRRPQKQRTLMITDLHNHSCRWSCLVRSADAQAAGQLSITEIVLVPKNRSKEVLSRENNLRSPARKHQREKTSRVCALNTETERLECTIDWPQVESDVSLAQIMRENRAQTSAAALSRSPCSFCNHNELLRVLKFWAVPDLDISLLEKTVDNLRTHFNQPNIKSHSLHNGRYQACPTCARCVKGRKFFKLPLYSWANGCWIGPMPVALHDLTYAEELVIARAHTTKCWAKINAGTSCRPLQQRSASGNVCIHPHEISNIATTLPRPMSALYDEIVVIFVSDDKEATAEMFKRTPFLVRRGRILRALSWLKANNPLYRDITIDLVALAEYPPDDDGCVSFPVQYQTPNDTIRGQNATYTGHGIDTTEAIFAENSDVDGQIPLSLSGTFDVDNTKLSLNDRKIEALRRLKADGAFVKSPTSSETLSTRHNPDVYGMLWPTLFPYGVGMFDDPIRLRKDLGLKPIALKSHVKHLLQLADRRFQTHI
ncbi:hypothetical protein C8F04DRAFT_1233981 [Mycena alexandri]|uniref:DUF6570 domain-containing protein n=1 Tax=Mycena alexandri TaxID=1745969 RepID=A0AAD6X3A5_9AGAR|nr:hypothetical protein C8F04DRAFT_1233981 [Mycena alexandri]